MRAYAYVSEGTATVYLPSTSNRTSMEVTDGTDKSNGWYRVRASWDNWSQSWVVALGSSIKPATESKRLGRMADRLNNRVARTRMPGIAGYQKAENASTGAIETNQQVNRYFATFLAERA